jgi:ABC-type molybdate transport system substrate-binding protein
MKRATTMRRLIIASTLALLALGGAASAVEIKAMITTAMKDAVDELAPQFEKRGDYKVSIAYGPSGGLARRYREGEPADMILIAAPELDRLMVLDKVLPGSTEVSRTGIGICV